MSISYAERVTIPIRKDNIPSMMAVMKGISAAPTLPLWQTVIKKTTTRKNVESRIGIAYIKTASFL